MTAGGDITIYEGPVAPVGGPPGRVWNVARPVTTFTARDVELAAVTSATAQAAGAPVVLHGMPGVGKTQLGLAWVHAHAGDTAVVWQIRAMDRLDVVADLAQLADRLGVADGADLEQAAAAAVQALNGRDDWLLLFDDATVDSVRDLVPVRGGRVLVTSRDPNWATAGVALEVGLFAPHAAAVFLDPDGGGPQDAAVRLAAELGYLPLALEQARAYCATTGRSLDGYLADYRGQQLLQHGIDASLHAPVTVTLALALDEAHRRDPGAAHLMMVLAQLAPTDVPRDLLGFGRRVLPAPLAAAAGDGRYADRVLAVLRELALVTIDRPGLVRVHQLVADIVRDQAMPVPVAGGGVGRALRRMFGGGKARRSWTQISAELLVEGLPADTADPASWDRWALLLPHVDAVADRSAPGTATIGTLRDRCGNYLRQRGEYRAARRRLTHAVEVRTRLLGEEHPATLVAIGNLALVLQEMGELSAARELHERVLVVRRRVLGDEHRETLVSMNNLALVVREMGELPAARELHEQELAVCRRVLGDEHRDTLVSMNNLAVVVWAMGELPAAREMYEDVLAVWRRVLGEEHPSTLVSMNNLAGVLYAMGELPAARELHERVLVVRRRVLGEEHPDTLVSTSNLALVLHSMGELPAARGLNEQVLAVWRRVLGEEHPSTLTVMSNLAGDLQEMGELPAARELHEQVFAMRRRVLGEEHPDTLVSMNDLALLRREGEKPA
jgi:hypothetical protein